jgi:phosphoglucomutase
LRIYLESYEPDSSRHDLDPQDALKDLVVLAKELSQLQKYTGRDRPTVIT